MGQIVFLDTAEMEWLLPPSVWEGTAAAGEPSLRYKRFSTGVPGVPVLQLVEYEPDHFEKEHSHPGSEMLFVLDGEATIGGRLVGPGGLVYVEGGTTYGPIKGGPNGMRFLRIDLSP